jgi:hypothetical protein
MFGVSAEDPEELKYAASVVLAAVDGLAFQACLDPEKFDLAKAFAALERIISVFLQDLLSRQGRKEPNPLEHADRVTDPAADSIERH